ncbi:hypothetical protein ABFS83_12G066200 [Erythranthe nasuta]
MKTFHQFFSTFALILSDWNENFLKQNFQKKIQFSEISGKKLGVLNGNCVSVEDKGRYWRRTMGSSLKNYHTLVVSLMEEYVREMEDAVEIFKANMTISLGPRAIPAILDRPMPPLPPGPVTLLPPIPVPDGISPDDLALTFEKIKQLRSRHGQMRLEMEGITKVIEYLTWMQGWSQPPLYDYVLDILSIVERYNNKTHYAIKSFRRSWECLRLMILDSPYVGMPQVMFPMLGYHSALAAGQTPPPDDTIQKFEELKLDAADCTMDQ